MSIIRQLPKKALEKQDHDQQPSFSSQSNVADDHESLADNNKSSYYGRNGNST